MSHCNSHKPNRTCQYLHRILQPFGESVLLGLDYWLVGFRLSEYLGQGDAIIQDIVAISRSQAMCYVVREAISTPGCPNLYWALATLPEPTVSIRRAIDLECLGIEYSFPVLFKAESTELGPEQWKSFTSDN